MTDKQAIELAKKILAQNDRSIELSKKIREDDTGGLESSEAVELEMIAAHNCADAVKLAFWLQTKNFQVDNKDRVKFWLRQAIRDVEAKVPALDQERMAMAGMSYTQRIAEGRRAEKAAEDREMQLYALREALRFIDENAS